MTEQEIITIVWRELDECGFTMRETWVLIQKVNQKVIKYQDATKVPLSLPVLVAC